MANEWSFLQKYTLIAQSPLIHFQPNEIGATLRATEVKPKLDRFLIKQARMKQLDISSWYIADTTALNYKLRFLSLENDKNAFLLGRDTEYSIFWSDDRIDKENPRKKKGVKRNVEMTVICFIPELQNFIDNCVGEFFVATNFGTCSGKGFGSFTVLEKPMSEEQIATALKSEYGAKKCYSFDGGVTPFQTIRGVYYQIKSGINDGKRLPQRYGTNQRSNTSRRKNSLLFSYMEEHGIGNEKDWLKKSLFYDSRSPKKNYRFVRALFGLSNTYRFNKQVFVKVYNKNINKLASPIIFKVIDKKIYMIASRINEAIYGAQFDFKPTHSGTKIESTSLNVPDKRELGENFIDDFMAYAVDRLNREGSIKIREVSDAK